MLTRRQFITALLLLGLPVASSTYSYVDQNETKNKLDLERERTLNTTDTNLNVNNLLAQADKTEKARVAKIPDDPFRGPSIGPIPQDEIRPIRFIEFVDRRGKVLETIRLKTEGSKVRIPSGERFLEMPGSSSLRFFFEALLRAVYYSGSYFIGENNGRAEKEIPREGTSGEAQDRMAIEKKVQPLMFLSALVAEYFNGIDHEKIHTEIFDEIRYNKAIQTMLNYSELGDRYGDTLRIRLLYDHKSDPSLGRLDMSRMTMKILWSGLSSLIGIVANCAGHSIVLRDHNDFVSDWKNREVFDHRLKE